MANPFVNVKGLDHLIKDLNKLPINVQNTLDAYMQKAFDAMVITAKSLVPVDTGALKNSIGNKKMAPLSYAFYAFVYYAPYVEFGTGGLVDVPAELKDYAMQFKGAGIKQINLPARPYWWPAFMSKKNDLAKEISESLLAESMKGITVIKLVNTKTKTITI